MHLGHLSQSNKKHSFFVHFHQVYESVTICHPVTFIHTAHVLVAVLHCFGLQNIAQFNLDSSMSFSFISTK